MTPFRYDPTKVQPMRGALTQIGFCELLTPEAVDGERVLERVRGRSVPSVLRRVFFTGAALTALACAQAEGPARVDIVEPVDGAVVSGPDVRVVLTAAGVEIAPASEERSGTAHHHLFIDRALTPASETIPAGVTGIVHLGRGQTEFLVQGLAAGTHTVIAVLADWAHVALDPLATDTVRFTVQP